MIDEEEQSRRLMRGILAGALIVMPFWLFIAALWCAIS